VPERQAVAVVVRRGAAWLMVRRPGGGLLGGLWELPGGGRRADEPLARAARRGLLEQTGLEAEPGEAAEATLRHAFSHFTLVLQVVRARRTGGRLKAGGGSHARWVTPDDVRRLPVATAHRKLLARLGMV
jgi:A/G-specific adenine glycosylase